MSAQTAPSTGNTPAQLLAKLIFGILLSRNDGIRTVRKTVGKLKQMLGDDAPALAELSIDVWPAVGCACADEAILGKLTEESRTKIKQLPVEQRVMAELLYNRLTGKLERNEGRWAQDLWEFRRKVDEFVSLSPTKIPKDELAKFAREIVTELAAISREFILDAVK